MENKKPFKETQVGQWITQNVPGLVNTIENFVPVPIKGGMEVLKKLVGMQPNIDPAKIDEFNKLADDFELQLIQLHNEEMANARASNIQIQSSTEVPKIVKLRPTILAFFVASIWGSMTIYLIVTVCNLVKRDPSINYESIWALYAGLNLLFGQVLSFDFGSSAGSKSKEEKLDKLTQQ